MPKRRDIKGQRLFNFEAAKQQPKKQLIQKINKRAQIQATKNTALRLASQVYANILNNPQIFQGTSAAHKAMYKREFGMDIGALKKGRVSAVKAQAIIGKAKALMDKYEIKYNQ